MVHAAHQIIFLGFAFHPFNVNLLKQDKHGFSSKVFATGYGLSGPAKRVIEADVRRILIKPVIDGDRRPQPSRYLEELNFGEISEGAYDFLNSHFRGIAGGSLLHGQQA
jgi:hypothetical protein